MTSALENDGLFDQYRTNYSITCLIGWWICRIRSSIIWGNGTIQEKEEKRRKKKQGKGKDRRKNNNTRFSFFFALHKFLVTEFSNNFRRINPFSRSRHFLLAKYKVHNYVPSHAANTTTLWPNINGAYTHFFSSAVLCRITDRTIARGYKQNGVQPWQHTYNSN